MNIKHIQTEKYKCVFRKKTFIEKINFGQIKHER